MSRDETSVLIKQIINPKLSSNEQQVLKSSKIRLPKYSGGHLSPTQSGMYWRCPMQYYFRYVLGLKVPPAVALVEGGSHHNTFEYNNKHKIKTGKDRSVKQLCSRFCDTFNEEQKEIPKIEWRLADTTKDKIMRRGTVIQQH